MSLTIENHPIGFVYSLVDRFGDELTLSFSRYFYRANSLFDERETFDVPVLDVTIDWFGREVLALLPKWELAMNSVLRDKSGRLRHVGMIDFVGRPDLALVRSRVKELLGSKMSKEMYFYDSGRSIHGYFLDLMSPREWREFLARVLLMNVVGEEPVVDGRWIGHRLLGGYSALRWSANSNLHSHVPVRMFEKF